MSFKVIGIGEVLWDLLPSGPQLGGAPANFVCHAAQLGASAQLISRVGADPLGQRILASLAQRGLDTTTLQTDSHLPTGSVGVALGTDGTPQFTIHTGVAWDALTVTDNALATVEAETVDLLDIAPAPVIPYLTPQQLSVLPRPFIGSGLITTFSQIQAILHAGARNVAVTRPELWS